MEPQNPRLRILHVLTLNGPNGEYGGPVRVARELCSELNRRGHQTNIISGVRKDSEPVAVKGLVESFVHVKPLSKKFPVSSLWSWKLLRDLSKEIRKANLVHIHFARDLIPFFAAFISITCRKPFVTQTHGMIISDGRLSTKIIDLFFTRPLMNRSQINLVLTVKELEATKVLKAKVHSVVLPNGISVATSSLEHASSSQRIIFCARLEKRKGVDKFIRLAKDFEATNLKFEIYGPDGGQLNLVLEEVQQAGPSSSLQYKGAIKSDQVQDLLRNANLLILPSKDEPFPMVILEALAVGTPVLIMPSCGFAEILRNFNPNFVSKTESYSGLKSAFEALLRNNFLEKSPSEITLFCRETFGIKKVVDLLETCYTRVRLYV
jgi:glycosyltransferase involved in cell wall biosynthesis